MSECQHSDCARKLVQLRAEVDAMKRENANRFRSLNLTTSEDGAELELLRAELDRVWGEFLDEQGANSVAKWDILALRTAVEGIKFRMERGDQPDQEIPDTVGGVDIPTMGKMHPLQYKRHLQGDGGFHVDHHDVLRSNATGRPLAVTEQQYRIFMEELTKELCQSEMWNE